MVADLADPGAALDAARMGSLKVAVGFAFTGARRLVQTTEVHYRRELVRILRGLDALRP